MRRFEYRNPDGLRAGRGARSSRVSVRYLQEQARAKGRAATPAAG